MVEQSVEIAGGDRFGVFERGLRAANHPNRAGEKRRVLGRAALQRLDLTVLADHRIAVAGRGDIARWTWNHVALVRDGGQVRVYLNGEPDPEIDVRLPGDGQVGAERLFFGGRTDNQSNWEGRLDEIAVFDRVLSVAEIASLAGRE